MTREIDRREFLGAVGSAGAMLALGTLGDETADAKKLGAIGLQLYTVRGEMKKDFFGTLAKVARIGYKDVEFAGYFGYDAKAVRAALKQNGLVSTSSHIGFPVLGKEWDKIIEDGLTIGQKYLICPWIDEKYRTISGYKEVAELFNKAGEQAKKAGLQFGYHNHDFEFPPIDGQVPYDLLIKETDPNLVKMEMDVFWITNGGKDPVAYFKRYPGRFPLLHIKDRDAAGKMVDVGKGVIPWKVILGKRQVAGVKHIFVEHDDPADPFASIRDSYRYLRALDV
jgi:sugar phosphate isomerase/epimerase